MSSGPVRDMLRNLLARGDDLAQLAREALLATPPNMDAGRAHLRELESVFETQLAAIYQHVFSGAGRTLAPEFEYVPSGMTPFPNMAEAISEIVPSTIRLSPGVPTGPPDQLTRLAVVLADYIRDWRERFDKAPHTPEAVVLLVRVLGPMPMRLQMMQRIAREQS